MIKVIVQSTSDREQETIQLFERIRPYLDMGYTYASSLRLIGRISPKSRVNRNRGWFRDLVDYGESQGYRYGDYVYHHESKVGKAKVLSWDYLY